MRNDTKIAAAVFAAIPLAILSAAFATTWAIAHGASMSWRVVFRVMCHGIPSRCLTIWNVPMPICARCTAIYIGLFAGLVLFVGLLAFGSRLGRAIRALDQPAGMSGVRIKVRYRERERE